MTRVRKASALVTLLLLISAATAHAECAWVLWVKSTQDFKSEWSTLNAYDSRDRCQTKIRDSVEGARLEPKLFTVVGEDSAIIKIQLNRTRFLGTQSWLG